MQLLDHVSISVCNIEAAKRFYRTIMLPLSASVVYEDAHSIGFGERNSQLTSTNSYLSVLQSDTAKSDSRRHWCFRAYSEQAVRDFHSAGVLNGGFDDGPPGFRSYHEGYYAAFLLDPDGNKVEAVFHKSS